MIFRNFSFLAFVGLAAFATHLGVTASTNGMLNAPSQELIPNGNGKVNGCRTGGTGGINATEPSWVNAINRDHRKKVLEGRVVTTHVTHTDFPFNHDSHDMCFFVVPDPAFQHMQSDANEMHNGERAMEVEWETKQFNDGFWPAPGDRAWVIGRHVFDCGHPPYRTEIHPPVGVAFTRTAPMIFPGETNPVIANKTFIHFKNQGGYFVNKVGGTDYVFNVPVPGRRLPGMTPRARVIQRPTGGMPEPILTPKIVDGKQMIEVTIPLSGVADPTTQWNLYEWIPRARRIMATRRPPTWPAIDRPTNEFEYKAVIATSWTGGSVSLGRPGVRFLRVNIEKIKIHDKHEGALSGKGEINMQVRVNGEWIQVPEKSVGNGDTITVNQFADLFVADSGNVQMQVNGWEDDNDSYFRVGPPPSLGSVGATNENEKLAPMFLNFGQSARFGVGRHSIKSNPGDYTITFNIQELRTWPAEGGTLPPLSPSTIPPIRSTTGGAGHR